MIFSWESALKIVKGEKTQTRRVYKDGHILYMGDGDLTSFVMNVDTRQVIYKVGQEVVVQEKRGGFGLWHNAAENHVVIYENNKEAMFNMGYRPLKIRFTGIKSSEVLDIPQDDIEREGFKNFKQFARVWAEMHDKQVLKRVEFGDYEIPELRQAIRACCKGIKWTAWALDFEVVK